MLVFSRARFGSFSFAVLCAVCGAFFAASPSAHAQAAAAAAPIVVVPTPAKSGSVQSASFDLRWLKPSQLVQQLMTPSADDSEKPSRLASALPPGLLRVSPDDTTGRVFVQGTPDAVAQIQTIARLLDVEPRRIQLSLRILRAPINTFINPATHLPQSEVVTTVTAACVNNQPLTLHAIGDGQLFRVQIMPHVNGDDSLSVRADLSEISVAASVAAPVVPRATTSPNAKPPTDTRNDTRIWARRIVNGATVIAVSVPDLKNKNMSLYLEVTPLAFAAPKPTP